MSCVFCQQLANPDYESIGHNAHFVAYPDGHPVTKGHALLVSKRHVANFFDLTDDERISALHLLTEVKSTLDRTLSPDGYNIGVNCGEAAGQTVFHVHLHLIPRYAGDVPDPRGGVRHVIPGKGNYLS